jgi:NAD(P)-dependent dehydrogenase (short-subunit alcohol dehydrogenase family)
MDTGLKGKVVLITGAGKGIGRATALAFAKEGAHLALIDLDKPELDKVKKEAEALGVKVSLSNSDLGSEKGVTGGIKEVLGAFGGSLDVLVNNVGAGAVRTFEQLSDADWDATMNLNFMSYVRAIRVVLPILREKGGAIVNNASDLARQPEPVPVDYSVSKAAVLALTKAIARTEGPKIRVNAVAPGPVWTPLNPADRDAKGVEKFGSGVPMKRPAQPEEIAPAYVFLAAPSCSSYITGEILPIIGGYSGG